MNAPTPKAPTRRPLATALASASLVLLAACGGGGGDDGPEATLVGGPMVANDFTFPDVNQAGDTVAVAVPEGPLPAFSARRKLSGGSGNVIEFGDPVVLDYTMFSWKTGEMVETTDTMEEPVTLRAGINEGAPAFLTQSLLGRSIGDTLQVVFEGGMEDLPEYLDENDAYIVVVTLI